MKTRTNQVKRSVAKGHKQLKTSAKGAPTLPNWVIGVYDGPKDKRLSTREGYSR